LPAIGVSLAERLDGNELLIQQQAFNVNSVAHETLAHSRKPAEALESGIRKTVQKMVLTDDFSAGCCAMAQDTVGEQEVRRQALHLP
jgi:hypothetical protein